MGLQTQVRRQWKRAKAQGTIGGKGVRAATGDRLQQGLCSGGAPRLYVAGPRRHRAEKWEMHHMAVKTAFLNGELGEEVYVARLCKLRHYEQSVAPSHVVLRSPPGTASMEHQVGQHAGVPRLHT
jgi:hypothetical protein